jgi:tetratricopeptide (TPR) repeat protein
MKKLELNDFLNVLNQPEQLKILIENSTHEQDLDESILGFIAMYRALNGDVAALKLQLETNKATIINSIKIKARKKKQRNFLKFAAVFIGLIIGGVLLQQYTKKNTLELNTIYSDPGIPIFMGTNSDLSLDQIMYSFRKKDYTSALQLIEKESVLHSNNDTLIYYNALVHHYLKNDNKALFYFKQLENKTSKFTNKAHYFSALSAVNLCKYNQAIHEFKVVCNSKDEDNDDLKSLSCAHILAVKKYLQSTSTHTSK